MWRPCEGDVDEELEGRDVAALQFSRLVDELPNPLVAWLRDAEPLGLGADAAIDLRDRERPLG
jgi:hypothetical protein